MASTVTYTPSANNYYNASNVSGGSGIYLGSKRKVRFTMSTPAILALTNGREVKSAKFTLAMSKTYNESKGVTLGCSNSGSVGTVFPNKSSSGHKLAALNTTTVSLKGTITLTATAAVQYALAHYSGTWYLWLYDHHSSESGLGAKTPRLQITVEDSFIYIHDGTAWKNGVPYVWDGGAWRIAVMYRRKNGAWSTT